MPSLVNQSDQEVFRTAMAFDGFKRNEENDNLVIPDFGWTILLGDTPEINKDARVVANSRRRKIRVDTGDGSAYLISDENNVTLAIKEGDTDLPDPISPLFKQQGYIEFSFKNRGIDTGALGNSFAMGTIICAPNSSDPYPHNMYVVMYEELTFGTSPRVTTRYITVEKWKLSAALTVDETILISRIKVTQNTDFTDQSIVHNLIANFSIRGTSHNFQITLNEVELMTIVIGSNNPGYIPLIGKRSGIFYRISRVPNIRKSFIRIHRWRYILPGLLPARITEVDQPPQPSNTVPLSTYSFSNSNPAVGTMPLEDKVQYTYESNEVFSNIIRECEGGYTISYPRYGVSTRIIRITMPVLTKAERDSMIAFFQLKKGSVESFNFTPEGESTLKVRFASDKFLDKEVSADVFSIDFMLEETL